MSYEANTGLGVSNHYGPRKIGNQDGVYERDGEENTAAINFDGDTLSLDVYVPANSVVTEVVSNFATGAITAATVGSTDISGANGAEANYVAISTKGKLTVTGPTAGTVLVKYLHVAA